MGFHQSETLEAFFGFEHAFEGFVGGGSGGRQVAHFSADARGVLLIQMETHAGNGQGGGEIGLAGACRATHRRAD